MFTESFIWKVLQNVGRHSVDVKSLKASDLDKLAVLIANALQAVEQQAGQMPRDLGTQQNPEDQTEDLEYEDQIEQQHPDSDVVDQIPEDSAQKQNEVEEENVSVTQKTLQTIPAVTGNISLFKKMLV